jgi:hypothetical protein
MKRKGLWVVVGLALLVALGLWALWRAWHHDVPQPSHDQEPRELRIAKPKCRPSDGSKMFPKNVTATCQQALLGDTAVPVMIVRNVDSALDLEAKTAAIATKVKLSRTADGLDCTVWSERGRRAIQVEGSKTINAIPSPDSNEEGRSPSYATNTDYANAGIKRIDIAPTEEGPRLMISSAFGEKRIPFGDFRKGECRVIPGYRYAVMTKVKPDFVTPIGVVVVDTQALTLCGEIEYPKDLPKDHPLFVVDPRTNGLVVMDGDLKWMMVVDLGSLATKAARAK